MLALPYYPEEWKDINGYEGLYQVSSFGRVKSLPRNGTILIEKIITCSTSTGYCRVVLSKGNKTKNFNIHRLVAEAFIPNPNNLPCVNHKDENKRNNFISNLEWCTHKYNNCYGSRIQRVKKKQLNRIDCSKPVAQYSKDGELLYIYPSMKEASRATGVKVSNISSCCLKKRCYKTAGGYIWNYVL